ncbi:MAG: hypothetical protein ACI94Y_002923 [Maribacter sp.]|jgi:hypothetical protein
MELIEQSIQLEKEEEHLLFLNLLNILRINWFSDC